MLRQFARGSPLALLVAVLLAMFTVLAPRAEASNPGSAAVHAMVADAPDAFLETAIDLSIDVMVHDLAPSERVRPISVTPLRLEVITTVTGPTNRQRIVMASAAVRPPASPDLAVPLVHLRT